MTQEQIIELLNRKIKQVIKTLNNELNKRILFFTWLGNYKS